MKRPASLITKQAIAAVGQSRLMRVYDDFFSLLNQPIAQVLLSRENLSKMHHYKNAKSTFNELLRYNTLLVFLWRKLKHYHDRLATVKW